MSKFEQSAELKKNEIMVSEKPKSIKMTLKILENINAAVYIVDMDNYIILFLNKFAKKIWGDIEGKKCWETIQKEKNGPCHFCPKDKLFNENGNPNGVYNWEFQNIVDGTWYNCHDSAIEWINGKIVKLTIATDITEHIRLEKKLIESQQTLDALMEYIPIGITISDSKDFRLRKVSKHGLELMGWPKSKHENQTIEEILGKWEIFKSDGLTKPSFQELPLTKAILEGKVVLDEELVQRNIHGHTIPITCDAGPIYDKKGNITGGIVAWQDITKRRQHEELIQKQNEELKEANLQKDILLKEIHHRVKNNLQIVQSLLIMQKNYIDNEKVKNTIDECVNRIVSMSLLHENLYKNKNISKICMRNYFNNLISSIKNSYNPDKCNIHYHIDVDDLYFNLKLTVPIGLLANELITNAIKYAFKDKTEGNIFLSLKKIEEKFKLIIKDDGIGLPDNFNISKNKKIETDSYGIILINIFSKQLNSELIINVENGTEYIFIFSK